MVTSSHECSICLETSTDYAILSCNHRFHHKCAIKWFIDNDTCPLCRKSIGITKNISNLKYITLYNLHLLNFTDLNRIYYRIIDIISIDETTPGKIQWNSFNSIYYTIRGGQTHNKKIITYVITKTQNHYTIRSSYVDYWKYPIKKKHNKKINNRRNKNY